MEQHRADDSRPSSDLPAAIGRPALRALTGAGITRLTDLTAWTAEDLLRLHGFGPKALGLLREALAARHLSLRP
ncbi:DNA-binding protein [Deinococcus sonorensis]|uniref:DNA-binding protein n=2 Tax=Deinococcus sonorensis TaxID=309891 RepID=A0AAU7U7Z7_9DEIO